MIQFDDCSFRYKGGEQYALRNISLEIADGEFAGVTGASGAGKTTFTYMVSGLVPQYVEFTDQDVLFLYSTYVVNQSAMLR